MTTVTLSTGPPVGLLCSHHVLLVHGVFSMQVIVADACKGVLDQFFVNDRARTIPGADSIAGRREIQQSAVSSELGGQKEGPLSAIQNLHGPLHRVLGQTKDGATGTAVHDGVRTFRHHGGCWTRRFDHLLCWHLGYIEGGEPM